MRALIAFVAGLVFGSAVSAIVSFFLLGAPEREVIAAIQYVSAQCVRNRQGLAMEGLDVPDVLDDPVEHPEGD